MLKKLHKASYYRSYVYQFATIAKPIHQLAEKERDFEWNEECKRSIRLIKEALCSDLVLAFPTETDPFIIICDASNVDKGAVLSQIQNGEEKVICYFSRCFFLGLRETIVLLVESFWLW